MDPDLLICDSHHHLWDGSGNRGRYLLAEYLADASSGHKIVKTVFAECGTGYRSDGPEVMRPVGETEFVQALTSQKEAGKVHAGKGGAGSVASAIIGFADLTLGAAVTPVLEAHLAAGGGRLRGIRQSCTWDSDPDILSLGKGSGMMQDSRFREGFARLGKYDLTFDAWQYFTQLAELADLAGSFPDTTIIVNHTGGPLGIGPYSERAADVFQEWQRGMKALATRPNVMVKLGGLGMPRCGFGWHAQGTPPSSAELAATMAPFFHFCIDAFGADRCMFESNFPVDKVSYSYSVLWNAFKKVCQGFSEDDRVALFHGTAARVYHLGEY